jgi:thiamine phosphate synthase YjbQ (UPF0047 family)
MSCSVLYCRPSPPACSSTTTPASGPVAQPHRRGRLSILDRAADAHLKRQIIGREVVVAVTNGRQDGFASLTRTFGTWERILCVLTAGGGSGCWSR